MGEISVVLLVPDAEERTVLQMQVDATAVGKTVQTFSSYPVSITDPIVRRIHDARADVVIIDVLKQAPAAALRCIELLNAEFPNIGIFACGDTNQPQTIISAMRAGAREFLERPTTVPTLLDALVRLTSAQRKSTSNGQRGKIITILNTKGGSGATTIAVNTALALQSGSNSTVLVDLAPLGHVGLHLNLRAQFTVLDALNNVQRLDRTLLETYLVGTTSGLQVLAASDRPQSEELIGSDFARLFDVLVANFKFVVVDLSSRLDRAVKIVADLSDNILLVAQPDVASLWSAAKLHDFLGEAFGSARVRLVLNRFRKIPGFSDNEVESATRLKVLMRIPSQFQLVAGCIDRGIPVSQQNHSDLSKSYHELASLLVGQQPVVQKRRTFSLFGAQ
jgi:pilus assembly protein CpaE